MRLTGENPVGPGCVLKGVATSIATPIGHRTSRMSPSIFTLGKPSDPNSSEAYSILLAGRKPISVDSSSFGSIWPLDFPSEILFEIRKLH